MVFDDPPYASPIAVSGKPGDGPAFKIGWDWQKWVGLIAEKLSRTPERKARVGLTSQQATINTTPIPLSVVRPGVYRVSYWIKITQAATVSSSFQFGLAWTRHGLTLTAQAAAVATNTTSTYQFGTLVIHVDATTPISYDLTYASSGATPMRYELDVVLEELAVDGV